LIGIGEDKDKKIAEEIAAQNALDYLKHIFGQQ
jgi:dsRNA-specific ribonuclease